jgi:hypothetical protein
LQSIPHGLLSGINNISSANFYSMNLPINEAAELVKNYRQFFDIIEAECQSDPVKINNRLEEIENDMDTFMEKNKVWDRKNLLQGLEDVARKRGNFVCLLGGKSTGKSLVLRKFSEQEEVKNRKVIYVNMRAGYASITYGFLTVVNKSNYAKLKGIMFAFAQDITSKLKVAPGIEFDFKIFQNYVKTTEKSPHELLDDLLNEMMVQLPEEAITLVIDEANIPLTINDKTSEENIQEVKKTLALFTRLTKELQKVCALIIFNNKIQL